MKWLLALTPAAAACHLLHAPSVVVFLIAALALIPLAGLLGEATEELAAHVGERWGGFLNATFGNLGELIIALVMLSAGQVELVKLSLIGSVMGNLFLVLGCSLVVGGIRHKQLFFRAENVGPMVLTLFLALTTMLVPTIAHTVDAQNTLEHRTTGIAFILMAAYVLLMIFRFQQPNREATLSVEESHEVTGHTWSKRTALLVLAASAIAIGGVSEILVHHLDAGAHALGWSSLFVGLFVIPFVGNIAEHFVAITAAAKNRMDFSLEISVGSATQIALFVVPVLMFTAPLFGTELTLVFSPFAISAISAAIMGAWLAMHDGKSDWHEGAFLLLCGFAFAIYAF